MFKKTADLVGYGTPKVDEVVVRSCLTQMSQRLHVSRVALSMPKVKVTPVSQSVISGKVCKWRKLAQNT